MQLPTRPFRLRFRTKPFLFATNMCAALQKSCHMRIDSEQAAQTAVDRLPPKDQICLTKHKAMYKAMRVLKLMDSSCSCTDCARYEECRSENTHCSRRHGGLAIEGIISNENPGAFIHAPAAIVLAYAPGISTRSPSPAKPAAEPAVQRRQVPVGRKSRHRLTSKGADLAKMLLPGVAQHVVSVTHAWIVPGTSLSQCSMCTRTPSVTRNSPSKSINTPAIISFRGNGLRGTSNWLLNSSSSSESLVVSGMRWYSRGRLRNIVSQFIGDTSLRVLHVVCEACSRRETGHQAWITFSKHKHGNAGRSYCAAVVSQIYLHAQLRLSSTVQVSRITVLTCARAWAHCGMNPYVV
jgi:hypothetical protein